MRNGLATVHGIAHAGVYSCIGINVIRPDKPRSRRRKKEKLVRLIQGMFEGTSCDTMRRVLAPICAHNRGHERFSRPHDFPSLHSPATAQTIPGSQACRVRRPDRFRQPARRLCTPGCGHRASRTARYGSGSGASALACLAPRGRGHGLHHGCDPVFQRRLGRPQATRLPVHLPARQHPGAIPIAQRPLRACMTFVQMA